MGRFRRGASQARDVPGQHVIGGLERPASLVIRTIIVAVMEGGFGNHGSKILGARRGFRQQIITVCGEAVAGMERPIVNLITSHAAVAYSISSADTNCM